MKALLENTEKLCNINGISGREDLVVKEIVDQIKDLVDFYEIDNLNNIVAFKKGKKVPKNKILIGAHTDEVGMILTGITKEGYLRFSTVGGINTKVILGRSVTVGDNNIQGVIGTKAIHQQSAEERRKVLKADEMLIDIGAIDDEDAKKHVALGDSIYFNCKYQDFGTNSILAKALDDRLGCAVMIELMKTELEYDTYFGFFVQEEVGLRGSRVVAQTLQPDIAIIIESTASGDVASVEGEKRVTVVGEGAVITYMDNGTIYDRGLYKLAFKLAEEKNIKVQTKTMIAGGNDAGIIHCSGKGVRCVAVSVPSKYIHSASSVINKDDYFATHDIVKALASTVGDI